MRQTTIRASRNHKGCNECREPEQGANNLARHTEPRIASEEFVRAGLVGMGLSHLFAAEEVIR